MIDSLRGPGHVRERIVRYRRRDRGDILKIQRIMYRLISRDVVASLAVAYRALEPVDRMESGLR